VGVDDVRLLEIDDSSQVVQQLRIRERRRVRSPWLAEEKRGAL
jgi:hypothetical protein